jgi:AcrR family transcriptional regulator
MDEIAREMGISKKTIYQYFENKDDLVHQWTQNFLTQLAISMKNISQEAKNAIEESLLNEENFIRMFTKMNPTIFHDLKKYFPAINDLVKEFEKRTISQCVEKMIERGIDEKIFRSDILIPIVAKIHFHSMDLCFDYNEFPKDRFEITSTLREIQEMFLRGLCNEEGLKLLNQYRSLKTLKNV